MQVTAPCRVVIAPPCFSERDAVAGGGSERAASSSVVVYGLAFKLRIETGMHPMPRSRPMKRWFPPDAPPPPSSDSEEPEEDEEADGPREDSIDRKKMLMDLGKVPPLCRVVGVEDVGLPRCAYIFVPALRGTTFRLLNSLHIGSP